MSSDNPVWGEDAHVQRAKAHELGTQTISLLGVAGSTIAAVLNSYSLGQTLVLMVMMIGGPGALWVSVGTPLK